MMLAGLPVQPAAVDELAVLVRGVGGAALADRLERALADEVKLLALSLDERAIMLSALEDPPQELAELRAVLLADHEWRRSEGLDPEGSAPIVPRKDGSSADASPRPGWEYVLSGPSWLDRLSACATGRGRKQWRGTLREWMNEKRRRTVRRYLVVASLAVVVAALSAGNAGAADGNKIGQPCQKGKWQQLIRATDGTSFGSETQCTSWVAKNGVASLLPKAAQPCFNGGWQSLVQANGTSFADQAACTTYASGSGNAWSPLVLFPEA